MQSANIRMMFKLFLIVMILIQFTLANGQPKSLQGVRQSSCEQPTANEHLCYCGVMRNVYDRYKGETCVSGQIIHNQKTTTFSNPSPLRQAQNPINQSSRDQQNGTSSGLHPPPNVQSPSDKLIPLHKLSIKASIDAFAADVTITQAFTNMEPNTIEAMYIFPIEENAAVYSFTAQIDQRIITAELKEKTTAEQEYKTAISQGQAAVLFRQNEQTLDTFTINVGSLRPGETCLITIKYVSELELVDGQSIRFVVPTTIAPQYIPPSGGFQSPNQTAKKNVQNTPYSLWFEAHIARSQQYDFRQVANLSHPMDAVMTANSIDVSMSGLSLDNDIILDIDLPLNRPTTLVRAEKDPQTSTIGVLFAFIPRLSDLSKISSRNDEINTEFIFIVDCSASMQSQNRISLAKEAMMSFLEKLTPNSQFNIIRFRQYNDVLFKSGGLTTTFTAATKQTAISIIQSLTYDGHAGADLLGALKYVQKYPPAHGRSRQIFLLTAGDIPNTNEVIDLCRSMPSSTRIFSIGLGSSPSRSLIKGMARVTNGYPIFIPPNVQVDLYVASHFDRALQPSIVDARLEWQSIGDVGRQAPMTIPPLYTEDRVLVYQLFDDSNLAGQNINVNVMVGSHQLETLSISTATIKASSKIHRLAAKALIQEFEYSKSGSSSAVSTTTKEEITKLSLDYQILSPYTAFVGVERNIVDPDSIGSPVPTQMNKGGSPPMPAVLPTANRESQRTGFAPPMPDVSSNNVLIRPNANIAQPSESFQPPLPPIDEAIMPDQELVAPAMVPTTIATTFTPIENVPVRWFIDRQSFNGAWILNDQDVFQITSGKSFRSIKVSSSQSRDVVTTALAIAVLESKYADQMRLWKAAVSKARRQLEHEGLTKDEINALIDEIKPQLSLVPSQ